MALLEIRDITSGYGEVQILWGVSLKLEPGKLTTLVGSNGAGKTTLLRTIMGLVRPWQGQITFRDQDVTRLSPHEKAADGLVLVPEGRQLFTEMSVLENLEMGAVSRRARPHKAANLDKVFALFPRLKERGAQQAGTLSGGEQQMLAIGRGLMIRPRLLMLDEPSLGLAPIVVEDIFRRIQEVNGQGTTILLIEQNANLALSICDYAYLLSVGRIVLQGTPETLKQEGQIVTAYLGGAH